MTQFPATQLPSLEQEPDVPVSESQLGCYFSDTVHLQSTRVAVSDNGHNAKRPLMVLSSLRRSLTVLGNNRIRQRME